MRHDLTKRVAWPGQIKSAEIRAPSARAKTVVSRGFVSHSPGVSASRPKIQTPGAYATDPGSGERLCEACQETCELAHKQECFTPKQPSVPDQLNG